MTETWHGIMPIVVTPFTDSYSIDEAALQELVAFSIEAGATGLVGPANASEFSTLSDDERRRWIEIVVAAADGRVPVVASITSGHAVPAVALAQFAQATGADGIMSMPPHVLRVDQEGCYAFYQQLAAAVEIPICVQNFDAPVGTPMSGELLGRMCRELAGVDYIKEETVPPSLGRSVARWRWREGPARAYWVAKGGSICSTNIGAVPAAICRAVT